ncbi:hypothetical protein SAMN05661093_10020 [Kibdelosporangium aridum]|uniref:Tat pathway signal sequence domain protein n=1 Tax=Kibdelosporangium aridum TaxID=2030 RepID=A0A1Y5Y6U9_KIBAR|nr:hypothetical protein SAMN05661093_10020 [Kibdelosporangium aridum]
MDRRTLLRVSAASLATGMFLPNVAFADPTFPDVPNMLGDRKANEFWYEFDNVALFDASPEMLAAYDAINNYTGGPDFFTFTLLNRWLEAIASPGYPHTYTDYVTPIREPLQVISGVQLSVMDKYYRPYSREIVDAYAYFGQGVLFDPRRTDFEAEVHTMDGDPPIGYHVWYAIQRAMMLLGIDTARWVRISPLVGFAWALQSIAKPNHRSPNPGLPMAQVNRLAAQWLPKSVNKLDQDFRSTPYPPGI